LRLIAEHGLEDGGVEALAAKLGIGSRHLRRLFLLHLGATPIAVAHTTRLHFAKKLIDETALPMNEIAMASGFGCVRRFNAHIRSVYKRTPTQIRRLSREASVRGANEYLFRLQYRPPFDWETMLSFLKPRAIPGVENVEGGIYRRTIAWGEGSGSVEVSHDARSEALLLGVHIDDPRALFAIVERVRGIFDLNADWQSVASNLRNDEKLGSLIQARPGIRVPGCWDGFELAVRAILGQQVTVKGATTLSGRLVERFGKPITGRDGLTHLFPSPKRLMKAEIASIGIPTARAETIRRLAAAVQEGTVRFDADLDAETLRGQLSTVPGIGAWTAGYIAMRALKDPDGFPSADLGLLRTLCLKTGRELEERAESWRPWRAYAAMYVWSSQPTLG
jgi:AraC family transcriptional regulator of adaptative response / DNA-3-methyladenine glycosylase II